MKKRLLFVIESLTAAGAERSLISLLSAMDYSRFEVDLQLFSYGGELERYLPNTVHLLPPLDYTRFLEKDFWAQMLSLEWHKLFAKSRYSFLIRLGKNSHADRARKYWRTVGRIIPKNPYYYDATIAYSQGIPSFYVSEKTSASNKIAWVNVTFSLSKKNERYQNHFYHTFHHIVCVSKPVKEVFDNAFPEQALKTTIIHDRIDKTLIRHLAEECLIPLETGDPIILTVARFAPQKGYDLSLEACRILKLRGIRFKWYAIGRGPLRKEMEQFVREDQLQDCFFFLGTFPNPYPYFKAATLYVQTSRHEGFGLAIAEARILGKPVITTEFDAVWQQMVQGKNGLVVPQDPVAIADAIERLLFGKDLYQSIVSYLAQESFDSENTLLSLYELL